MLSPLLPLPLLPMLLLLLSLAAHAVPPLRRSPGAAPAVAAAAVAPGGGCLLSLPCSSGIHRSLQLPQDCFCCTVASDQVGGPSATVQCLLQDVSTSHMSVIMPDRLKPRSSCAFAH